MRQWLVSMHRWTGLVLVTFLVVAGATGMVLAWADDLERLSAPAIFTAPAPPSGAALLDPLVLREKVAVAYPTATVTIAPLDLKPGIAAGFFLSPKPGTPPLVNDQIFVDPATGRITGERRWGDIMQGPRNMVPFIYRLHYGLALGGIGNLLFGIAAILWTIDCFVGAWLTFPLRVKAAEHRFPRRGWWARWKSAWKVRRWSWGYKLHFDLHRAGGLWLWAMLLVFAWSSVNFNMHPAYQAAMRTLFGYQDFGDDLPVRKGGTPALSWQEARAAARKAMAAEAARRDFTVLGENRIYLNMAKRAYVYRARTSNDVSRSGDSNLYIDADTGRLLGADWPGQGPLGNSITTWIEALHTADIFGWWYRLFVTLLGAAVVMLSVTGVVIWNRKRNARRQHWLKS